MEIKPGKFCVYKHLRKGKVAYVGKGISSRPFSTDCRSELWRRVFKDEESIEVEIVKWFDDEKAALDYERKLINQLKPVCNVTNGGGGVSKRRTGKRKIKNFSVSFTPDDMRQITEHLEMKKRELGFSISRNELIRQSVLSVVRSKMSLVELLRRTD